MGQAIQYLGGKCQICGYAACPEALNFHHVRPRDKLFEISRRASSFQAIQKELDKCELLCCRCHCEVHAGLHPGHLVAYLDFDDPLSEGESGVDL
jgi:hypothetical protein